MTQKLKRQLAYFMATCLLVVTSTLIKQDVIAFNKMIVDTKPVIPVSFTWSDRTKIDINVLAGFEKIEVCHHSSSKTYMLESSFNPTSVQAKYIKENTTAVDGLFYDKDGYIAVALGSYFGEIGNRFIFTLDTGIQLRVIKAEYKADIHTNDGCEQKWDKSVIEFIIDPDTHSFWVGSNGYIVNGNFNNLEQYNGNIIKIVKKLDN